jgi:hypothetical protein
VYVYQDTIICLSASLSHSRCRSHSHSLTLTLFVSVVATLCVCVCLCSYEHVVVEGRPGLALRLLVRGPAATGVATAVFVGSSSDGGAYVCHDLSVDVAATGQRRRIVLVSGGRTL